MLMSWLLEFSLLFIFYFCCLQTSGSYLHFYHIKVSEKQLRSSVHDNLELALVSVVFSTSVDAALYNRAVTVYATILMCHRRFRLSFDCDSC